MKPYILCLFIGLSFYCSKLNAQSDQLESKIIEALSTLDQSQCTSGRLYERVPEYYPFLLWRGEYLSDSTSFLISRFSMLSGMLRAMDIDQNSVLPSMDSIISDATNFKESDTLRMGIILYNYDRLDTSAISNNLIFYQNDHFYDVPGRQQSPYVADTVFAFSTFNHLTHNLHQKFVLPLNYVLNTASYSSIEIDFDDGIGYQTIQADSILDITYQDFGIKRINCRLTGANGRIFIAQTILEIIAQTGGLNFNIDPDESISLEGVNLYWWYNKNCDDTKIRKPLILIEGFDPLNTLGTDIIFDKYGGNDFGLLAGSYEDQNFKKLSEYLHDDDYDVFYIDYKQGHIRIQDNAEYVIEAIEWINARKHKDGSYEPNVVIGASMGGVVGYFALKTMENAGQKHEAELFLTVDSPLKGANIPLGMQAFVQELGDYSLLGIDLKNIANQDIYAEDGNGLLKGQFALNSPAARQMLYYHYSSPHWTECPGFDGDCKEIIANQLGPEHDLFYAELNALGDLNIPHFGISNGSIKRKGQQFPIATELADRYLTTDELLDQIFNDFWSDATEILVAKILGSGFFNRHIIHAVGANGKHRVYYGGFSQVILLVPIVKIVERHVFDSKPYDSAPGGMRIFEKGIKWKNESFCFIPTISSLKLNTTDPYYNDIPNLENVEQTINQGSTSLSFYSGALEQKPFYGNGTLFWNEDHVSLNKRLAEYLRVVVGFNQLTISNPLDQHTFNFGNQNVTNQDLSQNIKSRYRNIINYDLTIENAGKLWVNRYDKIGYTQLTQNPLNRNNSIQDLQIVSDCVDSTEIYVKVGGEIKIGDNLNANKSTVYFNDSTRLYIENGGLVKLEEESNLYIEEGAVLRIKPGGTLQAEGDAKIIIKKGGKLILDSLSILNLNSTAEVVVNEGGTIIINGGSIFRFVDPVFTDGRSKLTLKTRSICYYNGSWEHDGNGYVQFDHSVKFYQGRIFKQRGIEKGVRFLRLNSNTKLRIFDHGIKLALGKVEYEPGAGIYIDQSNDISSDSLVFRGTINYNPAKAHLSMGLNAQWPDLINLNYCDFIGLDTGVYADFFIKTPAEGVIVSHSTFDDVKVPLHLKTVYKVKLDTVSFKNGDKSIFNSVYKTEANGITVENMGTGFFLSYAKYFLVKNSEFINNYEGIYAIDKSNVFVYQSLFGDNESGIYSSNYYDKGIVEIGCSEFVHNGVSISGRDVLLSISPLATQTGGFGAAGNNTFIATTGLHYHFWVLYELTPVAYVNGEKNYWGGGEPSPDTYEFWSNGVLIPLLYNPYNQLPVACSPISGGPGITSNDCGLIGTGGDNFNIILADGRNLFFNDLTEQAEERMQDISDSQNTNYFSSSEACKFNYDYARAFTEIPPPIGSPIISDVYNSVRNEVNIYPNPFKDNITVVLPHSQFSYRLIDNVGNTILSEKANSKVINLKELNVPNGIYVLEFLDLKDGISITKKIIKF